MPAHIRSAVVLIFGVLYLGGGCSSSGGPGSFVGEQAGAVIGKEVTNSSVGEAIGAAAGEAAGGEADEAGRGGDRGKKREKD